VADSGLRAPEPLCGTRHTAFAHQNIEHHQQVEIKAPQIDLIHDEASLLI
jgi:hypothetical protein